MLSAYKLPVSAPTGSQTSAPVIKPRRLELRSPELGNSQCPGATEILLIQNQKTTDTQKPTTIGNRARHELWARCGPIHFRSQKVSVGGDSLGASEPSTEESKRLAQQGTPPSDPPSPQHSQGTAQTGSLFPKQYRVLLASTLYFSCGLSGHTRARCQVPTTHHAVISAFHVENPLYNQPTGAPKSPPMVRTEAQSISSICPRIQGQRGDPETNPGWQA